MAGELDSDDARGGIGGWYELAAIYRENYDLREAERAAPPAACPDCGEPLRTNLDGQLHCSFDGSLWEEGPRRIPRSYTHN